MKKKLTKKQAEMLWTDGRGWPYSQAKLIKEVRILNESVSRIFLIVEVEINPTTFELIKKNRNYKYFKDDIAIQDLIDYADYRGPEFGYVSISFSEEYRDEVVIMDAELALQCSQNTIIKMHKFIMDNFYV